MSLGKTIRLYLMDGAATGPIEAEVINWTGRVTVVPRANLHELSARDNLQGTGVYILVGPDPGSTQDRVYIGEADGVYTRLKDHDRDERKQFWTRAAAVTSKDLNLTKAHARYLESRLIELAKSANRMVLDNATAPAAKTLPEADRADMEYFLEQLRLVLPALGLDVLRPAPTRDRTIAPSDRSPCFVMEEVGVKATAYEIEGQFVVLEGSTAREQPTPAWDGYVKLREQLVAEGRLTAVGDGTLRFAEDVEFSSTSAAAACVAAANRNGRTSWKVEDTGQTYADWKESLDADPATG